MRRRIGPPSAAGVRTAGKKLHRVVQARRQAAEEGGATRPAAGAGPRVRGRQTAVATAAARHGRPPLPRVPPSAGWAPLPGPGAAIRPAPGSVASAAGPVRLPAARRRSRTGAAPPGAGRRLPAAASRHGDGLPAGCRAAAASAPAPGPPADHRVLRRLWRWPPARGGARPASAGAARPARARGRHRRPPARPRRAADRSPVGAATQAIAIDQQRRCGAGFAQPHQFAPQVAPRAALVQPGPEPGARAGPAQVAFQRQQQQHQRLGCLQRLQVETAHGEVAHARIVLP